LLTFFPIRYYETHVRLDVSFTQANLDQIKALSKKLSTHFERPIPVSYNALEPHQIFLNFRTRGLGQAHNFEFISWVLDEIVSAGIPVSKVIREYVAEGRDDNIALDSAWIEPKPRQPIFVGGFAAAQENP
jgi:hypothetical protein